MGPVSIPTEMSTVTPDANPEEPPIPDVAIPTQSLNPSKRHGKIPQIQGPTPIIGAFPDDGNDVGLRYNADRRPSLNELSPGKLHSNPRHPPM